MQPKQSLKVARFPAMIGSLSHSIQIYKALAIFSCINCSFALLVLSFTFDREPLVVAFDQNGNPIRKAALPNPENAVREAAIAYLEARYQWDPTNVANKLSDAEAFILPANHKAFRTSIADISNFARAKRVSQMVYADKVTVDLTKKSIKATGNRVTAIEGLKAASNLNLELTFEFGPRTKSNPWGIYVVREKESI